jgi:hypothetical protein
MDLCCLRLDPTVPINWWHNANAKSAPPQLCESRVPQRMDASSGDATQDSLAHLHSSNPACLCRDLVGVPFNETT